METKEGTSQQEIELTFDECERLVEIISKEGEQSLDTEMKAILASKPPNSQVGPHTFFPEPTDPYRESPLLAAAKYGNVSALKYFLNTFASVIDVNDTCACAIVYTFRGNRTSEVVHKCSPLIAACLGENVNLDVVKLLVSRGASVNLPNCRQTTPLMGVAFSGNMDVLKYLVENGAEINAVNLTRSTPLCAAAKIGQHEVIKYLLRKGANLNYEDIKGHTALHMAAGEGHFKAVRELLAHGASPKMESYCPGSVVPPVLMAASEGHPEVVKELLTLPNCPTLLKVDTLLLLGATVFEQKKPQRVTLLNLWSKALTLRTSNTLGVLQNYSPPVQAYGNRAEIKTHEDFRVLRSSVLEIHYQALIMRERIMGYGDFSLIQQLSRYVTELLHLNRLREAELLWIRLMDMLVYFISSKPTEYSAHFFPHYLVIAWRALIEKFVLVFQEVNLNVYQPNFKPFVEFELKGLEFLELPLSDCPKPSPLQLVTHALSLFCMWLRLERQLHGDLGEVETHSDDCETLGRKFVAGYVFLENSGDNLTLLHLALDSSSLQNSVIQTGISWLIPALLRWGSDAVVDVPNLNGMRPLHLAISNTDSSEVLTHLLDYGAHLDAVNAAGKSVFDIYRARRMRLSDPLKADLEAVLYANPLSLACHACRVVVAEGLPYEAMPPHVKDLIRLHDKAFQTAKLLL